MGSPYPFPFSTLHVRAGRTSATCTAFVRSYVCGFPRKSRHISKPTRKQADHHPTRPPLAVQFWTHNPIPKVDPRSSLLFSFSFDHITFSKKASIKLRMNLGVNDNPPSSFWTPHVRKTKDEDSRRSGMSFLPLSFPCPIFPTYKATEHTPFSPVVSTWRAPIGWPDSACGEDDWMG